MARYSLRAMVAILILASALALGDGSRRILRAEEPAAFSRTEQSK